MSRFDPASLWGTSPAANSTPSESDKYDSDSCFKSADFDSTWQLDDGSCDDLQSQMIGSGSLTSNAPKISLFLPLHYESRYQYPLLVWLHHDGHNEKQINQVLPHVSVRNFIGLGLRGTRAVDSAGHRFEWRESPAGIQTANENLIQAIQQVCDLYTIHSSRIVLAGYQSGATMAIRLAMQNPQRFAGVVALGGRMPQGFQTLSNLADLRARQLPMLWQVACESPVFSNEFMQNDIRAAMMVRAKLEVRQYVTDDEMNTVVLSDMNDWLMSCIVAGDIDRKSDRWSSSPTQYSCN